MVAAILHAAERVLLRDGARYFTTIRVAEEAGVSVGSLYQYFPNKESILFRLQVDEWDATTAKVAGMMERDMRGAIRMFFHSECEEAELRRALESASALYENVPEKQAHAARTAELTQQFVDKRLPDAPKRTRVLAAQIIRATMSGLGKEVSDIERSRAEVDRWADAAADMLDAYLARLAASGSSGALR